MEHQLIKPSRTVSPGDKITIKYRGYQRVFEVLDLPKSRLGARLVAEYVREITPQAELEKRDLIKFYSAPEAWAVQPNAIAAIWMPGATSNSSHPSPQGVF